VAKLASIVSALVAIGAGLYMLTLQTTGEGTTIFEAMAHGIGAYFIGKGIFMGATLWRQDDGTNRLGMLVDFAAQRHARETAAPGREDYSGLPPG
jgi:hypothetical protein